MTRAIFRHLEWHGEMLRISLSLVRAESLQMKSSSRWKSTPLPVVSVQLGLREIERIIMISNYQCSTSRQRRGEESSSA